MMVGAQVEYDQHGMVSGHPKIAEHLAVMRAVEPGGCIRGKSRMGRPESQKLPEEPMQGGLVVCPFDGIAVEKRQSFKVG